MDQKVFLFVGVLVFVAYWCASTFMMLMNGSMDEFMSQMVISGFMMGMMNNPRISDPATLTSLVSSTEKEEDSIVWDDEEGVVI